MNGIHTIARRMDDETETINFPQVSNYISHLKVLMWATRDVITGTLYRISDFETPIYNYKMETVFATKAFVFKYPYDMFSVESSSDASCNRRAQVQKRSSKQSNYCTWAHINLVVNWNHEGFQTNLHTTKITVIQHNISYITTFCRQLQIGYNTSESSLLQNKSCKVRGSK